eukprot:1030467-Rhodomonas_salina.1
MKEAERRTTRSARGEINCNEPRFWYKLYGERACLSLISPWSTPCEKVVPHTDHDTIYGSFAAKNADNSAIHAGNVAPFRPLPVVSSCSQGLSMMMMMTMAMMVVVV